MAGTPNTILGAGFMARFSTIFLVLSLVFSATLRGQTPAAQSPAPADFDRLLARAMELHQAGDILGAIDTYKAALTINPERTDAISNLGAAYVRLGQFDDAVAQYERALKIDPLNNTIRLNLALAFYKSARPQHAIPQLKRVIASDP
jgi:Tfp pilus assembly protein PilF